MKNPESWLWLIVALLGLIWIVGMIARDIVERHEQRRVHRIIRPDLHHLQAVAQRCWDTGKAQVGTVDEHGNLTIKEVE